jgi:hypothetical protein
MSKLFPRDVSLTGALGLTCLLISGCQGPKFLRVSGTVRYRGKPVPKLIVKFVPTEGKSSSGFTDENGRYTLRYDKLHEGVVPGAHKVLFAVRPRNPGEEMAMQQGMLDLPLEVKEILGKYGKGASTLQQEVSKDGQVIDFDLD